MKMLTQGLWQGLNAAVLQVLLVQRLDFEEQRHVSNLNLCKGIRLLKLFKPASKATDLEQAQEVGVQRKKQNELFGNQPIHAPSSACAHLTRNCIRAEGRLNRKRRQKTKQL